MSQKHIGSLTRPFKRNWLSWFVQLAPGSGKGQSSREADHRRYTNVGPHQGGLNQGFLILLASQVGLAICRLGYDTPKGLYEDQGLAADNRQLGVPE